MSKNILSIIKFLIICFLLINQSSNLKINLKKTKVNTNFIQIKSNFIRKYLFSFFNFDENNESQPELDLSENKVQLEKIGVFSYSSMIKIGEPPQEIEVILDTGSGNILIRDYLFHQENSFCENQFYNCKLSSSFSTINKDNDIFIVNFGKGEATVEMNEENIQIGKIKLNNAVFGRIINENDFPNMSFGGVVGLGLRELGNDKSISLFELMKEREVIERNVISFSYFEHIEDEFLNEKTYSGEVNIGEIDMSKYKYIEYFPVVSDEYWMITLVDVKYNSNSLNLCSEECPCKALFDTGSSFISSPVDHYTKIKSLVFSTIHKHDFEFVFLDENNKKVSYLLPSHKYFDEDCFLINPFDLNSDKDIWVLGVLFQELYLTVFDLDLMKIGLGYN